MFASLATHEEVQEKVNQLWDLRKEFYEKAYIHLNTEFSSLDNLKLQLGLYEKKSAERELYKEKNMKQKPPSKDEAIKLMLKDPNLLKRPVIIKGKKKLTGFNEAELKELL